MKYSVQIIPILQKCAPLCLLTILSASLVLPAAQAQTFAYVTNPGANTVSVLDTAEKSVVKTIPVGISPARVALDANGARAYVTNTGSNSVSVIDTATNAVVRAVTVGDRPSAVAVTPDGAEVYVMTAGGLVDVIDTSRNAVVASIAAGAPAQGSGIAITRNGNRAYVAAGNLSVIDTNTHTVVNSFSVGNASTAVAISRNGARAYISNAFGSDPDLNSLAGTVAVVDTASNTLVNTIPFISMPDSIALTPDGARAYVAGPAIFVSTGYASGFIADRSIGEVDLATDTVTKRIILSATPSGMAVDADGSRVYVTMPSANTVAEIDTVSDTVTAVIAAGARPTGLGIMTSNVPETIAVIMDIRPGISPNRIRPLSPTEVIPVAILTTRAFDAATVNAKRVRFGATGAEAASTRTARIDVDLDGDVDMLLRFNTGATAIACGAASAALTGITVTGRKIEGSAPINTPRC